jgi:hypothetical protein
MEKEIFQTKTYTVKIDYFTDGTSKMERTNDGFNVLEIAGICNIVAIAMSDYMKGIINPTEIVRKVTINE